MPKVLQINSVVNTGSTGRIVEQMGSHAIKNGWESSIAYGRNASISESKLIKIGKKCDIYIHRLYTIIYDRHGLASVDATKKLINEIQVISPDVIHLHNIHGYYLNYPLLFDYLSGQTIPVIWTLHDCWAFTGHCSYFSNINCIKWQDHCAECPKKINYPSAIIMDNSFNNYDFKKKYFNQNKNITIVAVSNWLGGLVYKSFLQNHKIEVIYNGVNLDCFRHTQECSSIDEKYGLKNKKVLLAVATSWGKSKGWYDYIKLSELLPPENVIVMIGLSKKQKKTLPPFIIGIERTESVAELVLLYSRADVLLNLSYQETFGMTTVEAMACGTPVIVYNSTASPELINKKTGIIVEPGDINEVLKAIKEILKKGKIYYKEYCRQLAVDKYNIEDRFNDYIELYEKSIKMSNK